MTVTTIARFLSGIGCPTNIRLPLFDNSYLSFNVPWCIYMFLTFVITYMFIYVIRKVLYYE